ncbi:EF-hand calcium-binding domain-containing protein 3-like [Erinaceus europaeus]|uniref:EF-hand calcium-binding domain-containing protein 3-like n=1 Tax=Erinaceus europaeus TaxID=9365 RepID=A0A1S3AJ80_ERIEU|nr:EF-hand calcium-binding domain-containing protein 3-like [Erinaceus europaeus]
MESAAALAMGAEQAFRRAREFKGLENTYSAQSGSGEGPQSFADENLEPLTPQQLAAFQDIFRLLSSCPQGTVGIRSMKAALGNVGIHLSPQGMCEALRQADLDGDGIVNFKDFLGVLTDSQCLAQCLGQVRPSQTGDAQGLQILFLELVFKLISHGFVSSKSVQEVMNYYSTRQRALRQIPGWKGRPCAPRSQVGLTFFCQAARISGLSSSELVRSLHRLCKTGVRSPYSQIPNLEESTRPELKTRNLAPRSEIQLPKSYLPSRPKLKPKPTSRRPGLMEQPLEYLRSSKLAPSPPTLVQKQPFSPPPAYAQKPVVKNLYK